MLTAKLLWKSVKITVLALITIVLIVSFSASNLIRAFDTTSTIFLNARPGVLVYDSGKDKIFIAALGSSSGNLELGYYNSHSVLVVSDITNTVVANVTVGSSPSGIAYDYKKGEIFVANADNSVSVISDSSNQVIATIDLKGKPNYSGSADMVYDSEKGEIFVGDYFSGVISVISDSTNKVVATIPLVNIASSGLVYDSGRGEIFVTYNDVNYDGSGNSSNYASVISDSNNSIVATVSIGNIPYPTGLAYDSAKSEIFVSNLHFNSVSVISDIINAVIATVPVGNGPLDLAYNSDKGEIFVANSNDNTISVISDSDNTLVATVPTGTGPTNLAYDSGKEELFITPSNATSISILLDPIASSSPSPTVPEFSVGAPILMMAVTGVVALGAFTSVVRKRSKIDSE